MIEISQGYSELRYQRWLATYEEYLYELYTIFSYYYPHNEVERVHDLLCRYLFKNSDKYITEFA